MSLCRVEIEQHILSKAAPEGMARVIYSRNPFDTSKHIHEFKEVGDQLSLVDVISEDMQGLPEELIVTSINGGIIKKADWEETLVAEGDVVVVFEVPGGGEDGKSILRLVLLVALVVFTQGLATAGFFGEAGFAASAFQVGFVVAGAVLINAILPPVVPGSLNSESLSDSRTYGIDGAKNTSDEGAPIPVCYGPFRMAGNIINFHTRNIANEQYLYLLLNAGEGVSAGLIDIELNEQPIAGFADAEVQIRLGDSSQSLIGWFSDTVSPTAVGVKVTTAFQTRTTGLIDRFRLDFVAPQGIVEYRDNGTRIARTITFDLEYKKTSEPTIWTSLKHRGTPGGTDTDLVYYEFDVYDTEGNYVSTTATETRQTIRDAGDVLIGDRIEDSSGRTVGSRFNRQLYTLVPDIKLSQTSAVRFSFYSPNLDQDTYDVRVRRTTVESSDAKIRDTVTWTDLNEIVDDDVSYKHTALVGLKIRLTDQLSSLPTVTYINLGRVIRFWDTANQEWKSGPSTNPAWIAWNALTNQRFGGQISESRLDIDAWVAWGEYCDNEGLVFQGVFDTRSNLWDATMHIFRAGHARSIKMGTRYSVAIDRAIAPSQMFTVGNIIKGSFKQKWMSLTDRANEVELHYFDETDRFKRRTIKVYDDVIVDGAPKNTASATMYGIVDPTRAAEEATYMLLNNRYIKSTVTFKAPSEAVAVTIGDVFSLQHDQPDWSEGGRLETGSTTTSMKIDKVVNFDGSKLYKFMVRFDYLVRDVATITAIVGKKLTLSGYGGATNINRCQLTSDNSVDKRITRTDIGAVWLDDVTGISVTDSINLIETDAIEIRDVVAATSGDLTTVPLTSPMPSVPSEHYLYMVGQDLIVESEWRVTNLTVDKNLDVTISGATYDERIYNWTPLTIQPAPDSGVSRVVPHVINLDAVEATINIGGILRPVIDISWDLPEDFENYGGVLVELNVDGGGYRFAKTQVGGLNTIIEAAHGDTIDVRVVAMSSDGRYALNSSAPEVLGLSMVGDSIAPAVPTSVSLALGTIGLHVSWVNPVDVDFAGCDIKRNTINNEGAATIIFTTGDAQVSYEDVRSTTATTNYFYWMRSVDRSGNASAWVATSPVSLQPTVFANGVDATTGLITNEQHGVPADSDGSNPVFSGASGAFRVWKGTQDITSTCTFSVFSADNLTGTINTAVDTPVNGQPKGYYQVTAETSAQDVHSFVLRAVTPDVITIDKTFTLTKNKAGVDGGDALSVALSASAQTFAYDESTGTPILIGPASIVLTVNEQNTTGATTWEAWDSAGVAISPVSTLLSSMTDAGATVLETAFDGIALNAFVKVRATRNAIFDEVTIHKLGSGEDGINGLNNSPALIYQRTTADSAPTLPSVVSVFTFATGAITGLDNGWTDTIPAFTGSNPYLWVTRATASNTGATDNIAAAEWQSAEKLAQNGIDGGIGPPGDDGFNTATLNAYIRSATPPVTDPGNVTYTFATGDWTPGNSWSKDVPAGTDQIYVVSASALATTATDDILAAEWTSPIEVYKDGVTGLSVASVYIYQRTSADSAPTLPSVTATFTFATGNVTGLDNGWTDTVPAFTGANPYLWVSLATASNTDATDAIGSAEWNVAQKLSQSGNSVYAALVYKRTLVTPPTPTPDDGSYNFGTGNLVPPSGWSVDVPDDDGRSLYVSIGTFEIVGSTTTDTTVTWSAPKRMNRAGLSGQILSTTDWVIPYTTPMGVWEEQPTVGANTSTNLDVTGPFGYFSMVMRMKGNGTNQGWFGLVRGNFGYDKDRSYIFFTWVKRTTAGSSAIYMGFEDTVAASEVVSDISGVPVTNPYFVSGQSAVMTLDKWYLGVGVVWADGAISSDQGISGIYDPDDGVKVYDGSEFQWNGQQKETTYLRIGHYDNSAPTIPATDYYDVTRVTGWVMDGSEPSVNAVLGHGAIQGNFRDIKFQRNTAQPTAPTGDSPAGWYDSIPSGTGTVWSTTGLKNAQGILQGVWSTPERLQGLTYRDAWVTGTAYILSDVVTFAERSYICVFAHTSLTTTREPSGTNSGNTYWDLLAGKGDTGDPPTAFNETIQITGTGPVNLRALADSNTPAYDGVGDATIIFQLATGITIAGNTGGGHGIDTGSWPANPTIDLKLEITGTVRGGGGSGGTGGSGSGGNGTSGGGGGDAIFLQEPMISGILVNSGGVVQASGGGGGGGGGASYPGFEPIDRSGGGGGGGFPNGAGGQPGTSANFIGSIGSAGTTGGGGAGGGGSGLAGAGGSGGNVNVNGAAGASGTSSGNNGGGGAAGARGYAVRKNGHAATVTNSGTVTGTQG